MNHDASARGIYIGNGIRKTHLATGIDQSVSRYLVNTLVTSIDQSVSKCKPPLRIRVIYLKKHIFIYEDKLILQSRIYSHHTTTIVLCFMNHVDSEILKRVTVTREIYIYTSIVFPLEAVTMSPGLMPEPLIIFSDAADMK